MCGFLITNKTNSDNQVFTNALEKISHRGPDNTKVISYKNIKFGFKRLSINDLTNSSNQPFEDDQYIFVFNGEIYNHNNLNYSFNLNVNKNSDSIVLFELLKQKKEKALFELNGMYSFVLYEKNNNSIFASRDIFGEKPLYYSFSNNGDFVFSSEIKSLLPFIKNIDFDDSQIINYFKNSYSDIGKTIYKGVYSLPPAHYLIFKNNNLIIKKYWNTPEVSNDNISFDINKNKVKNLLTHSINRQLNADVDVGLFLSGGIDSSLLLSLSERIGKKLKTFSFTFFDDENDDLNFINEITNQFSTDHHNFNFQNEDLLKNIVEIQSFHDEPFPDSSCLPLYVLSKKASNYVKAAITGDGADEIFLGYTNWFSRIRDIMKYSKFSNNKFLNKAIFNFDFLNQSSLLKYFYLNNLNNESDIFNFTKSPFTLKKLVQLGLINNYPSHLNSRKIDREKLFELFKHEIIDNYLPSNILYKSDRMSMAHSLELRSPFLDKKLVEYSLTLQNHINYENNIGKKILRELLKELRVSSKIYRRKKSGFGAPISKILSNKTVNEALKDMLLNKNAKIFKYINHIEVFKDLDLLDHKVWYYFIFELWLNSR